MEISDLERRLSDCISLHISVTQRRLPQEVKGHLSVVHDRVVALGVDNKTFYDVDATSVTGQMLAPVHPFVETVAGENLTLGMDNQTVYNYSSGKKVAKMPRRISFQPANPNERFVFSADKHALIFPSHHPDVLFDAFSGAIVAHFPQPLDSYTGVHIFRDRAIVLGRDRKTVYDALTGQQITTFPKKVSFVEGLADGLVAQQTINRRFFYDPLSGELLTAMPKTPHYFFTVSGVSYALCSDRVYEFPSGKKGVKRPEELYGEVIVVGDRALAVGILDDLAVYDVLEGRKIAELLRHGHSEILDLGGFAVVKKSYSADRQQGVQFYNACTGSLLIDIPFYLGVIAPTSTGGVALNTPDRASIISVEKKVTISLADLAQRLGQ